MVDLYVYYKVRDTHADQMAPLVRAMQAMLAAQHGVAGQLKRRPLAKDGVQTWMEIYPAVAQSFAATLEDAASDAGLPELTEGARFTETFMDLTPCA